MTTPITWTNDTRRLADLVPWEHNPKRMTKKQADGLRLSIERFGQAVPFLVSPVNEIYDGHQRQALMGAIKDYGPNATVDVRVSSRPLTDDERRELVVRLKQNQAGWDFDILPNLYDKEELLEWGFEPEELGFDLHTPSLEELEENYGTGAERDFWPYIRVQVSPETMEAYQSLIALAPGADEAAKVANILSAVNVAVFSAILP